jgi:hypothetical protein
MTVVDFRSKKEEKALSDLTKRMVAFGRDIDLVLNRYIIKEDASLMAGILVQRACAIGALHANAKFARGIIKRTLEKFLF